MNTDTLKKVDLNEWGYLTWSLCSLMTHGISINLHLTGKSWLILQWLPKVEKVYITASGSILASGNLDFRVFKLKLKVVNKDVCCLYSVWVNQINQSYTFIICALFMAYRKTRTQGSGRPWRTQDPSGPTTLEGSGPTTMSLYRLKNNDS